MLHSGDEGKRERRKERAEKRAKGLAYTSKDLADMLRVEPVTVRKYALALEKEGHNPERDTSNKRLYSDRDIMIFQQLKTMRDKTGCTVELAAKTVMSKHLTTVAEASDSVAVMPNQANPGRYDERYEELRSDMAYRIDALTQIVLQQQESAVAAAALQAPAMTPEQVRDIQVNLRMTEKRIERKLRGEAEKEWASKPPGERMRRVGLFRKEEDAAARERFIREYIDDRFEEWLQREFAKGETS